MDINTDADIGEKDRREIMAGLSRLLADSHALYLKTHDYHWNVTGPTFQALRLLCEMQYTELATAVEEIAEHIFALGKFAPGSHQAFAKPGSIPEEELTTSAETMIRNLVLGQEAVVKTARSVVDPADRARDEPTLDLLTRRIQVHEKNIRMLRSLLTE